MNESEIKYQWFFKVVEGRYADIYVKGDKSIDHLLMMVVTDTQAEGWEYVHPPEYVHQDNGYCIAILPFRKKEC